MFLLSDPIQKLDKKSDFLTLEKNGGDFDNHLETGNFAWFSNGTTIQNLTLKISGFQIFLAFKESD